jgi:hypothetical protein
MTSINTSSILWARKATWPWYGVVVACNPGSGYGLRMELERSFCIDSSHFSGKTQLYLLTGTDEQVNALLKATKRPKRKGNYPF